KPLRGSEIEFDVTCAHSWVLRRVGVPVTGHCVAICIELRLDVSQTFDGLTSRWFYFKFQLRRRAVDVQDMRLASVPDSETRCSNRNDRQTNRNQSDKQESASCSAPVKRE